MLKCRTYSMQEYANTHKNFFPYNLLFETFPRFEGNKFEKIYTNRMINLIDIKFSKVEKELVKLIWIDKLPKEKIQERLSIAPEELNNYIWIIKRKLIKNHDAITNGISNSAIGNSIKEKFTEYGLKQSTVNNLIDSGLPNIESISKLNEEELIKKLSKNINKNWIRNTINDVFSSFKAHNIKCKFKTTNDEEIKLLIDKTRYKSGDVAEVSVNCPCCGKKIIVGIKEI